GCAARVFMPATENATAYLLAQAGYRVTRRDDPRCCGALAHHAGLEHEAQAMARRTLDALIEDTDVIIVPTAAGCGAHLRSLGSVLSSAGDAIKADALATRVRDLSQALLEAPRPLRFDPSHAGGTVVFQDPCHLRHAQGITEEPRRLLLHAGATLFEAEGAELCCGSAGSYHLAAPELSAPLARSKCRSLLAAGTETVVTANPGCWIQLRAVWPKDGPRLTTLARYLSERVLESGLPTQAALQDDSSSSNPVKDAP
ncbi:MAG TPA: (Fe-S)-binding protein, partial [Candidatus Eisenbacteria bacterium]|nr:(Fe-S)-binding protein [Candidatus Eisenbacteria bacterium]